MALKANREGLHKNLVNYLGYPNEILTTEIFNNYDTAGFHNSIVRGKDITSYYEDSTLWDRIAGTNWFRPYEDLYLGDYFKMSRAISAYEQTQQY